MKLIIFGKEVDSTIEHEIECNTKFGLKATIKYNKDIVPTYKDKVRRNLTEFHHLYNKESVEKCWIECYGDINHIENLRSVKHELSSAFESDIHGSGGTQKVIYINEISIEYDTSLAENLYETHSMED